MNTETFNPELLIKFIDSLPFSDKLTFGKVSSDKGLKKISLHFDDEIAKQIQALEKASPDTLRHKQGIREFVVIARFAGDSFFEGSKETCDYDYMQVKEVSKQVLSKQEVLEQLAW